MKKRKFVLAALMLLMVNGAFAQIKIGIKAGANLSTFTNNDTSYPKMKMKFGFHVGGFAEFVMNDRISIQPELLYSAQGTILSGADIYEYDEHDNPILTKPIPISWSCSLGYINVPVLLKINIPEIAKGFSAEIGPQIGYLVSATSILIEVESGKELEFADIKEVCKYIDVTAVVGLSYTFAENFIVHARYGLGLTTIIDIPYAKNSVIQLSLGYKF